MNKMRYSCIKNISLKKRMGHLEEIGLGYFEHMKGAFKLAGSCAYATGVLIVHGLFPDFGGNTGSETLRNALDKLEEDQKRDRAEQTPLTM